MSKRVSAELEPSLHLEEAVGLPAGLGGAVAEGEGGGEVPGELDVGGDGGGSEVGEVVGREVAGNGGWGQGAVVEDVGEHVGGEEEAGVVEGWGALRHFRRRDRRVARGWWDESVGGVLSFIEARSTPTPKSRVLRVCALTWQDSPSNGSLPRSRVRLWEKGGV